MMEIRTIIDNTEERALSLFKLLHNENRWWTINELATEINISSDSVHTAIETLREASETDYPYFKLTIQKSRGIYMESMSGNSNRSIRAYYLEKSLTFKIIDLIFQTPEMTVDRLSEALFVSKSTIYRKFRVIEGLLNDNGLNFNRITLTFEGEEPLLREFFYFLYIMISRTVDWPFHSVPKDLLVQRYNELKLESDKPLSPIDESNWLYRLSINFIRQQQKYFINHIDMKLVDPYRRAAYGQHFKRFVSALPNEFQEGETNYLLLILSSYPIMFDASLTYSKIIDWHKETKSSAYQLTQEITDVVEERYQNIPFITNENTFFSLLCLAIDAINFKGLFHLTPSGIELIDGYQRAHPEFYNELGQLIDDIDTTTNYDLLQKNDQYLVFGLFTILDLEYDIKQFEQAIFIRITGSYQPRYELSLKEQLLRKSTKNIIVHTSKDEVPADLLYDLLLYDYTNDVFIDEKIATKHTYTWDYPPSERDWEHVLKLIDEYSIEKMM